MHILKKMIPRAAALFLFVFLLQGLSRFLFEPYDRCTIYARQEYKEEKGKVDMVFLGSSQIYTAFDPKVIDESLGTNSFNLGTNVQPIASSYELLRESLDINPVKTVYLEVNHRTLTKGQNESAMLGAFDRLITLKGRLEALVDTGSNNLRMRQIFYSLRGHDLFDMETIKENVSYKLSQEGDQAPIKTKKTAWQYYGKGHLASSSTYSAKKKEGKVKAKNNWNREKVQPECLEYLMDIIHLCKEKDAELILVTPALNPQVAPLTEGQQEFCDFIKAMADEFQIAYYNMNFLEERDEIFDYETFRDTVHLNQAGAEAFSKLIVDLYREPELAKTYFTDSYQVPNLPAS